MYNPNNPNEGKSLADLGLKLPKTNKIVINKKEFVINKHNPFKYWTNLITIGKYVGVPFSLLSGLFNSSGSIDGFDLKECLPQFFQLLFENLDEGRFIDLCGIILDGVEYENTQVDIEQAFEDDPENILLLVAKTLEVRYEGLGKLDGSVLSSLTGILSMVTKQSQPQSDEE